MASKGYPDVEVPDPHEILAGAGDLPLSHYLLAHDSGATPLTLLGRRSTSASNARTMPRTGASAFEIPYSTLRGIST